MMNSDSPISRKALEGLAAFLPPFEAPGFEFGSWSSSTSSEPGVMVLPMFLLSDKANEFYKAVYELGWIRTDFVWPDWSQSVEAERLRDDADAIARATPDQLARLLTTIIRSDRFCEGTLAACFSSGLLVRLLRRAHALCGEFGAASDNP